MRRERLIVSRRAVVIAALFAGALAGCRQTNSPSATAGDAGNASTVAVSSCAGQGTADRNAIASLSIAVSPAPSPSVPVAIYVEGEANRSLTRDSTAQIHRYELPRGLYDVRVTMPGFNTATARVTLTAGCNVDVTATLRRRVTKGR